MLTVALNFYFCGYLVHHHVNFDCFLFDPFEGIYHAGFQMNSSEDCAKFTLS